MIQLYLILVLVLCLDYQYGISYRPSSYFTSLTLHSSSPSCSTLGRIFFSQTETCETTIDQYLAYYRKVCKEIVVVDNITLTSLNLVQKMSKYAPVLSKVSELQDHQRVPGCISEVYIHAEIGEDGMVQFHGISDSLLVRGILGLLNHSFKHVQNYMYLSLTL